MAIIQPATPLPLAKVAWRLRTPEQQNRSGWTGKSKIIGLPGSQVWLCSGNMASITTQARALPLKAFFFALNGRRNSFPVRAVEQQQTTATNPTVRSGGNAGTTVPLQGLPANATVLLAGMMMTVFLPSGHRRLVGLSADLVSNGSGQGTATFWPELGEIPALGAAVEIQWPYGLMRQADDTVGWDVADRIKRGFTLNAEEAL